VRWLKNGSFGFAERSACAVGAKPNVLPKAFGMRLEKIVSKKVRWKKNKKHRVGNECRLTRFQIVVSFLCRWSPAKMVYFLFLLPACRWLLCWVLSLHLSYILNLTTTGSFQISKFLKGFQNMRYYVYYALLLSILPLLFEY